MNIYIFEGLKKVSDSYHEGGGLAVIAKSKTDLFKKIKEDKDIEITEDEWKTVQIFELEKEYNPEIFIFPNVGCC